LIAIGILGMSRGTNDDRDRKNREQQERDEEKSKEEIRRDRQRLQEGAKHESVYGVVGTG